MPKPKNEKKPGNRFYAEGNNGGDYIELKDAGSEGLVDITVGHCCVITLRARLPIEILTAALTLAAEDSFQSALSSWGREYEDGLQKRAFKRSWCDEITPMFSSEATEKQEADRESQR